MPEIDLEQLEPTQRRRAEALMLVHYLFPNALIDQAVSAAQWIASNRGAS